MTSIAYQQENLSKAQIEILFNIANENDTTKEIFAELEQFQERGEDVDVDKFKELLNQKGIPFDIKTLKRCFNQLQNIAKVGYLKKEQTQDTDKIGTFVWNYPENEVFSAAFTGLDRPAPIKEEPQKRGRPYGWSAKLGRMLTDAELEEREQKMKAGNFRLYSTDQPKGPRGRPKGWSMKLGRMYTPEELAAKEAPKRVAASPEPVQAELTFESIQQPIDFRSRLLRGDFETKKEEVVMPKGKRGRPKGYSPKFKKVVGPEEKTKVKASGTGKRGRPKGYSHTLKRFLTPEEIAAKQNKSAQVKFKTSAPKGKPGRPKGYSPKTKQIAEAPAFRPQVQPAWSMAGRNQVAINHSQIVVINLRPGADVQITAPKNLSPKEIAIIIKAVKSLS